MVLPLISGENYVNNDFRLIGRESDLDKIFSILMRQTANSLILFGSDGAGCSSILKGLQAEKYKKSSSGPFDILGKQFFWLDVDSLFSSSDPSKINENFTSLDKAMRRAHDSVLIIDNSVGFIDGAKSSGSENIINTIISSVRNGDYQVIFESHDSDIGKVLSIHSNMKDFFTLLEVGEPTDEELPLILKEGCKAIESHHMIPVSDEAIQMAINLTKKYRSVNNINLQKSQPKVSINLIDLAMSDYRRECHNTVSSSDQTKLNNIFTKRSKNQELLIEYQQDLIENQERVRIEREEVGDKKHYSDQEVDRLLSGIQIINSELEDINSEYIEEAKRINKDFLLSPEHVLNEFSVISEIPLDKLNEDEGKKLLMLEDNIKSDVFSQDHVVEAICNSVKISSIGLSDGKKPRGSFMLLGSSGVGKTYIAKRLAYHMYGSENAMLRFDMSEYMEKHSVSKLIGAPAGYDGYEHGGILTNAVRKNPYSIILLDEVEKAHVTVFDVLLQVLDDGRLTDNRGITVPFKDTLIIMTSNIGQEFFLNDSLSSQEASIQAKEDLDSHFRPEFLNRIGGRENIIGCNHLDIETIIKIANVEITKANSRLKDGINLSMDQQDVVDLCNARYNKRHGARSITGVFESQVYPKIADYILNGGDGRNIKVDFDKKTKRLEVV